MLIWLWARNGIYIYRLPPVPPTPLFAKISGQGVLGESCGQELSGGVRGGVSGSVEGLRGSVGPGSRRI